MAAAPSSSPWLFGRGVDLWFGYGLAYMVSVPLMMALVGAGHVSGIPVWGTAALALLFSTPHYGATLLRVYERRQDRQRYVVFAVWITLGLVALFGVGLWIPIVGSLLLTAYVTWSPWHFSGQNYGLAVMYLRRQGIEFTAETKRDLYVSFLLSAIVAILAVHLAGSTLTFANQSVDPSRVFGVIQLGVPVVVSQVLAGAAGAAYLFFLFRVARALLRVAPAGALLPVALLVGTQALWFAVPGLAAALVQANTPPALALPLSAVWISTAHAIQYLWVTCYYAQQTGEARRTSPFLLRSLLAGSFLALPALLAFPGLLGRHLPNAAGAAVLTFSVVNLHHFILDGAIWKLRDGRVARALLRRHDEGKIDLAPRPWLRPLVTAVGALCLVVQVYAVWLGNLASSPDASYAMLRSATRELQWMGRDTPSLWARLGQLAEQEGDVDQAIHAYGRAVRDDRQPPSWVADRLAWLLLRERADEAGSVRRAQKLASYVTRSLGPDRPEGYQTLAAAHAAAGDWDSAATAARQGLAAAQGSGDEDRARDLQRRLAFYTRQAGAAAPAPDPDPARVP